MAGRGRRRSNRRPQQPTSFAQLQSAVARALKTYEKLAPWIFRTSWPTFESRWGHN